MTKQDVMLVDMGNYYDFNPDANGDITTEDSFEASIITSLLVDKRASIDEMLIPEKRRGWIGSLGSQHEIGSKLWLYHQARLTDDILLRIESECYSSCKHFITDGLIKEISVKSEIDGDVVSVEITFKRFTGKTDSRYFDLWNNTGA
jgi:phage gp46-like protein